MSLMTNLKAYSPYYWLQYKVLLASTFPQYIPVIANKQNYKIKTRTKISISFEYKYFLVCVQKTTSYFPNILDISFKNN